MKKFVFRFESILKMRIEREEEIGGELAALMNQLALTDRTLKLTKDRYLCFLSEIDRRKEEGADIYEIRIAEQGRRFFKTKIRLLEEQRNAQYEETILKRAELVEAMKQRKIMEKLKQKAFDDYVADFEREEQRIIEEIVTYKGSLNRNGETSE